MGFLFGRVLVVPMSMNTTHLGGTDGIGAMSTTTNCPMTRATICYGLPSPDLSGRGIADLGVLV